MKQYAGVRRFTSVVKCVPCGDMYTGSMPGCPQQPSKKGSGEVFLEDTYFGGAFFEGAHVGVVLIYIKGKPKEQLPLWAPRILNGQI